MNWRRRGRAAADEGRGAEVLRNRLHFQLVFGAQFPGRVPDLLCLVTDGMVTGIRARTRSLAAIVGDNPTMLRPVRATPTQRAHLLRAVDGVVLHDGRELTTVEVEAFASGLHEYVGTAWVQQHPYADGLHADTTNGITLVTRKVGGAHQTVRALQSIGRTRRVPIDLATGNVDVSGGAVVPHWPEACAAVEAMGDSVPSLDQAEWDVVIGVDGVRVLGARGSATTLRRP